MFSSKDKNNSSPFVIEQGTFKRGRLNDVYRLSWTEEVFSNSGGRKEMIGRSFNMAILQPFLILLLALLLILLSRLAYLQISQGDYFLKMAEGNRIRIERVESRRGIIYDTNNKPLVNNVANFILYLTPADLPSSINERQAIIKKISEIISPLNEHQIFLDQSAKINSSTTPSQIAQKINESLGKIKAKSLESYQPLFVTDDIDYEKAIQLKLEVDKWKGVTILSKTRRQYIGNTKSLSHLLGYTGKINKEELKSKPSEYLPIDYLGKSGLEYFYESELRGTNGQKQIEVDALGKVKKILNSSEAQDGGNLVLSIDLKIQQKLEELVQKQLAGLGLKKASAVIIRPSTGEILGLVSLPAYDNNLFARGIMSSEYKLLTENPDQPLFNRAVSGEFPAGSTVKPVVAAAALNENIITENTTFLSRGGLKVGQWLFPDWKSGGHGITNVTKAIAESVNTFFYIIGGGYEDFHGLGVDKLDYYYNLFGLGKQTGIDIPGEANGFVPTKEWKEATKKERWYVGDTYHLAIGQGDLTATPLQIAEFTSYFANNGRVYTPHLVKAISYENGNKVVLKENSILKENLVRPEVTNLVRMGMRQTITKGSARSIEAVVPVQVAGKTGTAQWSTKKAPHAWFTGFAPFENPEIVITVLIEEGKEGSTAAVPIAKEFLKWYFAPATASSSATSSPRNK